MELLTWILNVLLHMYIIVCVLFLEESKLQLGFPHGSAGKESACNAGDLGSIPGLEKIPWRREWQPTPVFLPGESPWTEEPGGLESMGLQRVGHN